MSGDHELLLRALVVRYDRRPLTVSIPAELNHYRILGTLGSGGMGDVLLAEDTRLHRRVAIKGLSETTATEPGSRQRFQREALAVAAFNHPNIITIHSVEEAGGLPYLVMELVEGRTLADVLQEGRLPLDRLLRIGAAWRCRHRRGSLDSTVMRENSCRFRRCGSSIDSDGSRGSTRCVRRREHLPVRLRRPTVAA